MLIVFILVTFSKLLHFRTPLITILINSLQWNAIPPCMYYEHMILINYMNISDAKVYHELHDMK